MTDDKQIKVEVDGTVVAEATVTTTDARARAQVHVEPGHLPTGTRQQVAAAVHESAVSDGAEHLSAALPRGDAELVTEMREHLDHPELRSAGASSILEGDVRQP
ncbi:hypothetical protein ACFFOM_10490 [Microlunatus capsulatus]|uniref:DUF222 domain-containing protein n=1 Tax=Microlunatus capsulatus TaxID=99117 RepID=A0ABS4Z9W2_9ACTN|nr:hypothetical protein [Microlunatus capsulatus]MBP2417835.1 hypothetical protein [Microlunatus capsulatus]